VEDLGVSLVARLSLFQTGVHNQSFCRFRRWTRQLRVFSCHFSGREKKVQPLNVNQAQLIAVFCA